MRVFRFVTERSIEEKILERTKDKLIRDEILQQIGVPDIRSALRRLDSAGGGSSARASSKLDVEELLMFSAKSVISSRDEPDGAVDDSGDAKLEQLDIVAVRDPLVTRVRGICVKLM